MADPDIVIVGAGSTGCVLAARLSENPARRVLLVEAGPFYPTLDAYPPELAQIGSYAAIVPGHPNNWSFVSTLRGDRRYPTARGFAVGGSSTINGSYFVRGRPADFDGWAALGNPEWSWERVLPYFIRSETDHDFAGHLHGTAGPVPLKRLPLERYHPVSAAFDQACRALGFPDDPDKNNPATLGIGGVPRNAVNGIRMNMAMAYLAPALKRPNLTLSADTFVRRVIVENGRAAGIEADRGGERVDFRAAEIVLSAGGIKSPHLLMLSGIGDADALRSHGISVVHHSPGVGRHIMDHPTTHVRFRARDLGVPLAPDAAPLQAYLNWTAAGSDVGDDLQICCMSVPVSSMYNRATAKSARSFLPSYFTHPLASLKALAKLPARFVVRERLSQNDLHLNCTLHLPKSTGTISLVSADPMVHPRIDMNFLSHPDDLPRMRATVKLAMELLAQPAFGAVGATRVAPNAEEMSDDGALDQWIDANLGTTMHTSCGARMGPDSDPMAVVDQYGRVRGVDGLRVIDLSIIPASSAVRRLRQR